ncbi:MAG: DUF459 domain-containing protein [Beijerinckiaceae bacterium]|nr:DUF459 domain-containing protein [Beijerinckiaceae bacterium]
MTHWSRREIRPQRNFFPPVPAAASLAVLVCFFVLAAGTPAEAQFDPFGWIEQLFQPQRPPRVAKPKQDMRRGAPEPRQARPKLSRPAGQGADGAAKAAKPAVPPSYFVAVLGDSLAQMLGQGLTEAFENRPEVAILRKAKENSGLVRDDFYDWTKAASDLLASGEKIDFAVILVGSNDRQVLRDANGSYEPGSPEWQNAYAQRIEAIAALFRDKKIPLVWVGLPILKNDKLSADAMAFNEFYRAYAEKGGAAYLDIWEVFADEAGRYTAVGPDISGQNVRLRAGDGIHFTKAGARKLAHFVEPAIRRHLGETQPKTGPGAATEGAPEAANLPDAEAGESLPKPKPAAGPVLSLTSPAVAPGGELATRMTAAKTKNTDAGIIIEQTLQQGRPLAPKPGRADDYSWPRQ